VRRENDRMTRRLFWLTLAATIAAVASVIVSTVALIIAA
jgi:hypothetical protein